MLRKADSDLPSKLVALIGKEPTDHACTREPGEALHLYIEATEGVLLRSCDCETSLHPRIENWREAWFGRVTGYRKRIVLA